MYLPRLAKLYKGYPTLSSCYGATGVDAKSALFTVGLWLTLPVLVTIGSYVDNTWCMPGDGRGLLRHYGVWSLFITTPLIALLVALVLSQFLQTMKLISKYSVSGSVPRDLRRKITLHVRSLCLRGNSQYVLWLLMFAGLACGFLNIRQTLYPLETYGQDVFDAYPYMWGFVLNKIYLCLIWTLIYPLAIFVTVHITVSMVTILHYMCRHSLLKIDFFHPDNCGGVSIFGSINALIMGVWATIFAVIACLFITHKNNYATLVVALFAASVLLIVQSLGAVYYIHKFVQIKKSESVKEINELLNEEMRSTIRAGRFSSDLLAARNHILALNTYPYAKHTLALVNTLRYLPAAVALSQLVIGS